MQISNVNRYLLSIYVESAGGTVWSLRVSFWCFNISYR